MVSQVVQPDPPYVGESTAFIITATNNGPEAADDVLVLDTLSANMVYLSATSSQGSVEATAITVIASLGELGTGESATVTLNVILKTDQPATVNEVSVTSTSVDPVPENNSSTLTVSPGFTPATLEWVAGPEGTLVLSWPAYPDSWQLQWASTVAPNPQWQADSQIPLVEEGRKYVVIVPTWGPNEARYYELVSP